MFSILFVLTATLAAINISNFIAINNSADRNIQLVLERGLDDGPGEISDPESVEESLPPDETLMHENYFVVVFDENSEIVESNYIHIFSMTNEECETMAKEILGYKRHSGRRHDLKYKKVKEGNNTKVAVIDLYQHLNQARISVWGSLIVGVAAYLVILALILISSRLVIRPSEISYEKQKEFITNASHELKTPLTIISTDVEIIEMDHGQSEWTQSIKDQVSNLTQMTNQLVTSARLEEDSASSYPMEEFNVTEVIEESIEAFAASLKNKNLSLNTKLEKDVKLNGNKYLINELLYIFFDNALKYCGENGDVEVSLKRNKGKVEICFANTLPEGNKVEVDKLFDRFYRDPNSKVSGTGIGLAISKQIVELHKGRIEAIQDGNKIKFIVIL
jgi:signal transduction histidine kinase